MWMFHCAKAIARRIGVRKTKAQFGRLAKRLSRRATVTLFLMVLGVAFPSNAQVLVIGEGGFEEWSQASRLVVFGAQQSETAVATRGTPTSIALRPIRASDDVLQMIEQAALRYGSHAAIRNAGLTTRDWTRLFRGLIEVESAYNPRARSHVGAYGLGQLMPATAAELGVDRHDPAQNLDGAARYFLQMLAVFGTPELAIAAYNAGPDAVRRHGGVPPYQETRGHVRKVMAVYRRLSTGTGN